MSHMTGVLLLVAMVLCALAMLFMVFERARLHFELRQLRKDNEALNGTLDFVRRANAKMEQWRHQTEVQLLALRRAAEDAALKTGDEVRGVCNDGRLGNDELELPPLRHVADDRLGPDSQRRYGWRGNTSIGMRD